MKTNMERKQNISSTRGNNLAEINCIFLVFPSVKTF